MTVNAKWLGCTLLLFITVSYSAIAQKPVDVKDKYKGYQLKREVFMKWGNFKPQWFYFLFLNKYRKGPDRRSMLQLMPTLMVITKNLEEVEKEHENVDAVFKQEMFKAADRSLNKNWYVLYEDKVKSLNREIDILNAEAVAEEVDIEMILALRQEKERINADIKLTKDAYLDDSKKAEQFRVALDDLKTLRGYYHRLISIFRIGNKHLSQ